MNYCDTCDQNFDCIEPCSKVIAWEDLSSEFRIADVDYEAKHTYNQYQKINQKPNIKKSKSNGVKKTNK